MEEGSVVGFVVKKQHKIIEFREMDQMRESLSEYRNLMKRIFVGKSCNELPDKCFTDCSALTQVTFTSRGCLKRIGNGVFANCGHLKDITIPASIEELGDDCFSGCSSLLFITFETGICLKRVGKRVFRNCAWLEEVDIPVSVEEIDDECFSGCSFLSSVRFGNTTNLKRIGREAFAGCEKIREFEVPASVEEIGERCFSNNESLSRVTFTDRSCLKSIGECAFQHCRSIKEIEIPASVGEIGSGLFSGCDISSVRFSDANRLFMIIGPLILRRSDMKLVAFFENDSPLTRFLSGNCLNLVQCDVMHDSRHIREITIPAGVVEIGAMCFSKSSLSRVAFESGSRLKSIARGAFESCWSLKEIAKIPARVQRIGEKCFFECFSLSDVVFERGSCLKSMDKSAFGSCWSLKTITIPASVEEIGESCFSECSSLYSVITERGSCLKQIGKDAFYNCSSLQQIEIPSEIDTNKRCLHCAPVEKPQPVVGSYGKMSELEYTKAMKILTLIDSRIQAGMTWKQIDDASEVRNISSFFFKPPLQSKSECPTECELEVTAPKVLVSFLIEVFAIDQPKKMKYLEEKDYSKLECLMLNMPVPIPVSFKSSDEQNTVIGLYSTPIMSAKEALGIVTCALKNIAMRDVDYVRMMVVDSEYCTTKLLDGFVKETGCAILHRIEAKDEECNIAFKIMKSAPYNNDSVYKIFEKCRLAICRKCKSIYNERETECHKRGHIGERIPFSDTGEDHKVVVDGKTGEEHIIVLYSCCGEVIEELDEGCEDIEDGEHELESVYSRIEINSGVSRAVKRLFPAHDRSNNNEK